MKTRTEKRWICAVLSIVLLLAYIPAIPAQAESAVMQLTQNEATLTIEEDTVLDLNGYTVSQVNVNGGTLTVLDSKTDDYTVADGAYGKIVAATGAVKAQEGYMAIQETDVGTSYHKVDLTITAMSLRSKVDGEYKPSVYYKSAFKGDEKVAENVESYGIALSLYNNPTADGSNKNSAYSKFTEFQAGAQGNSGNGTLLSGIMKLTNSAEANQRNAEYQVYGRSYLKTKAGDYIYGNCVNRSLKQQLEAIAGMWKTYSAAVQNTVLDLCDAYKDVVSTWDNLPEITWLREETTVYNPEKTLADLENIPVATKDMTEEQLRQICIDFMRLQMTFSWTPRQTTTYYNGGSGFAGGTAHEMKHGVVYKGMPYKGSGIGGNGHGNIYTVMEYYNPSNGMLNTNVWKDGTLDMAPFTNQCSSSTFWAWARVAASANYNYTYGMTPSKGFLPIGWEIPAEWTNFTKFDPAKGYTTDAICPADDASDDVNCAWYAQTYANLKPGDGLLTSDNDSGHARMVVDVHVEKNASGVVKGVDSYVTVLEQEFHWVDGTQADGTACTVARGGTERKIPFYLLRQNNYVPITFAEFSNPSLVEVATATTSQTKNTMTQDEFAALTVSSNYAISDITFVIKNANGMAVCREFVPAHMWSIKKSVTLFNLQNTIAEGDDYKKILNIEDYSEYFDGNHTIEISAQLGSGQKPVVYTGTLVK